MIFFNKKKNRNDSLKFTTGFTLVETLIALFIFSISILTVMTVLSKGIGDTLYVKNKIIAEYLAQEGIEYFRNMRDTYMISNPNKNAGWNEFTTKVLPCSGGCTFNSDEGSFNGDIKLVNPESCNGISCSPLLYQTSTGVYGLLGGSETTFLREIRTEDDGSGNGLKITSKVTWGSGSNNISLSEILTRWME